MATSLSRNFLLLALALPFIINCGGQSSTDAADITEEQAETLGGLEDPSEARTGSFVDSPVSGIGYETESYRGITDVDGNFLFKQGEIVQFYVGNIPLGAAVADVIVTPLELGTLIDGGIDYANNHTDRTVNILRLLQSLDADSHADNGITITEAAYSAIAASATHATINVNLSTEDFESQTSLSQLILQFTSSGELVSSSQAIAHFKHTLAQLP